MSGLLSGRGRKKKEEDGGRGRMKEETEGQRKKGGNSQELKDKKF